MLEFKKWIISTLTNDATLQTLMGSVGNTNMMIYPVEADVQPEQFPSITYQDISNIALSVPRGMHIATIQFDIWSISNLYEAEQIYERLDQLFNYKDSTTQTITGKLWWIKETASRDLHTTTPNRRIWRKQVDYKYWHSRIDNT